MAKEREEVPQEKIAAQSASSAERGEAHRSRPDTSAQSKWDKQTKRTVLILLLAAAIFAIWLSRSVLPWLIVAGIISYLLSPVVGLLGRLRIPRALGTTIVFIILAVVMILLPILLAPVLTAQLTDLASFDVSRTASSLFNALVTWVNELPDQITFFGIEIPTSNAVNQFQSDFQQITFVPTLAEVLNYVQGLITTATGIVTSTTALTFNVVGTIFSTLVAIIVIYFMSLYLTKDMPAIRGYFQSLFPSSFQPELAELMRRIGYIWASFFRGQLILSFAIGSITWIVLTLVGMPGALVLAITAGALEVIPQFGPIIATIPAVIVALIQGSPVLAQYGVGNVGFALLIVGIYFVIQQLEGSILVPRIIGDSVNLHPVVVIMGVMVGLSTFGILGAFLAAPTLASIRVIGGYVHAKLLDYPPFQKPMIPDKRRQPYRRRVRGDQTGIEATLKAAQSVGQSVPTATVPLPDLPPGSPAEPKEISDGARTSGATR